MKNKTWWVTLIAVASLAQAEPVRLIFDTDMGNDTDDVMALCMIHTLQSRGAVDLLAVTLTKDHPLAAAFTDAVNTFYGRPDIPIGAVKGGATPEPGKFNLLAEARREDGSLRYPHDLKSGNDAPEATGLLRKILAAQPDHSVTLVQVGFFTNFRRLLESQPDAHSPLSGKELIAKKVKLLSVMAGAFQTINWNNHYLEYNVIKDIPAAQKLAQEWPTPVVWSGFEIGIAAAYPYESIEQDYGYTQHHPLPEAYALYSPKGHDRPTWDPTALLYAVYPDRGYFSLSPAGTVTVSDDGATIFRPGKDGKGRDRYLAMNAEQAARVREAIVQLCVAPPTK
ncbi:MAG TPA: nucleoside hydrolase [Kiritimatiellia bacterium]|nr:nucleoside hydrolase [Kiritimatiellia bacterium]HRU71336.1 nucleoside hydrolase [Kiritimatiellia bacterium]